MPGLNTVLKSFIPSLGEKRGSTIVTLDSLFSMRASTSTSKINASTALTLPAYYRGVNQIASDIAKLPKGVYKKTDGNRESLSDHPVSFLIDREASPSMDAYTFHFIMTLAAIHRGNGLAKINQNPQTGNIDSLEFIHPDDIRDIKKVDGKIWYYTKFGVYTQGEVIHIMGFTDNGIYGKGVIRYAAETMGISKAAQNFTASNFEDRGTGFGVVTSDKAITNKKPIEDAINTKLQADGKIKTVMLDEGMQYTPITLNMEEAQLIEQAKFGVLDIARFLSISPRKLGDFTVNNYASAYQDATDHVTDTIQPWSIRYQQEYDRKLFTMPEKQSNHYVKFNDNILLRGDLAAKGAYYTQMIFSGALTRNEVRAFEDLNAIEGLSEPLTPVNSKLPMEIKKGLEDEK